MKKMFTIIGLFYSLPAFAEETKKQCYKIIPEQVNLLEQTSLLPSYEIMCFRNRGSNPWHETFCYTHGEFSFFKVNEANSTAALVISLTIPYLNHSKNSPGFQILYGVDSSELSFFENYSFIEFSGNDISADLFIKQYIDREIVGKRYKCSMLEDELFIKYNLGIELL